MRWAGRVRAACAAGLRGGLGAAASGWLSQAARVVSLPQAWWQALILDKLPAAAAGTLASGMMYSFVGSSRVDGFAACFWASAAFAAMSAAVEVMLRDDQGGLMWGRLTLVQAPAAAPADARGGNEDGGGNSSKDRSDLWQ